MLVEPGRVSVLVVCGQARLLIEQRVSPLSSLLEDLPDWLLSYDLGGPDPGST